MTTTPRPVSAKISLNDYLISRFAGTTAATHLSNIALMNTLLGEEKAKTATYKDILEYISGLRKRYKKVGTIQSHLRSVKQYYGYLIHTGERSDHPCRYFLLKDAPRWTVQLQDLLSGEELRTLLHLPQYPRKVAQRTSVLMSLLVHQALTTSELLRIKTSDIDFERGTIYIRGTAVSNERVLPLKAEQVMLFYKYIREEREELLKRGKQEDSGKLLLSHSGVAGQTIMFTNLMKRIRKYYPGKRLTAGKIRQSVIAKMLKEGNDLRIVQAYSGHKYADSTERYRQSGIEALKAAVNKYHPLG